MGALKDAINAKATPHQRAAMAAEDWCRENGWTRICDIPGEAFEGVVYHTWDSLSTKEKREWSRTWHNDAEAAWLQYGKPRAYKVPVGYILDDGAFVDRDQFYLMNLAGRGFMMVFDLRQGKRKRE